MPSNSTFLANYLTRAELARELGRSEITLFRWARRRIGPPVSMVGVVPMYRRASVRAWLRGLEQDPAKPRAAASGGGA